MFNAEESDIKTISLDEAMEAVKQDVYALQYIDKRIFNN
jgi:hypothetical protein